eukprot:NODE_1996_length_1312_cov_30.202532_g1899_i0.p1 GENE.NODE_1996_length_1312_cov_30.202532_g1899_i0~~NODE_1996_length_1312_cov_30.202532_g1899_i0.p1  ORF type:complete len:391 (+),score=125.30 NODE_1996_length_1312_cov_30.202532_g1899_i0:82-1254(+)
MGLGDRLKTLDVFPKTLDEFKERTFAGASISILSLICIVVLVLSEVRDSLEITQIHDLYVDTEAYGKIPIHLNITFPHVPCDGLHLDAMDGFGESQLDVEHRIHKTKMDRQGNPLSAEMASKLGSETEAEVSALKDAIVSKKIGTYCGSCYGAEANPTDCCDTCDSVKEAYRKKGWAVSPNNNVEQCLRDRLERQIRATSNEGCNIQGHLVVNKVQGNFHFAPGKAFQQAGSHLHDFLETEVEAFNTCHTIHTLRFGEVYPGHANPLDGYAKTAAADCAGLHQYFIKVVPTIFTPLDGPDVYTNQYSVTEHFKAIEPHSSAMVPGVFFIYDLSPIMVEIRESRSHRSMLHFLTNLCAIIGGVFTVAGILDRILHSGLHAFQKQLATGKAS